ncbi:hypothetical protein BDR04DRAFT_1086653 [Suillus decipiens]|nr:hypothetical protein BDR04DRAFT_1086653 [Suillus decipiens]
MQALVAPPGVAQIPDPQLVDAKLRDARESAESMSLLRKHVTLTYFCGIRSQGWSQRS